MLTEQLEKTRDNLSEVVNMAKQLIAGKAGGSDVTSQLLNSLWENSERIQQLEGGEMPFSNKEQILGVLKKREEDLQNKLIAVN